ncbi:MAG: TRAP transporter large permease subunit [Pseudomonadota bacterium]
MTDQTEPSRWTVLYVLSVLLIFIGLLNAMPGIPGLEAGLRDLTGSADLKVHRFSTEYFYPLVFLMLMSVMALKHSAFAAASRATPVRRRLGLAFDLALIIMAATISVTYLVEIESVCLIDRATGVRSALIAESLARETELAELMGMPAPTSVDDPKCVQTTGGWLVLIVGLAVVIFLAYNVRVWGLPLVMVAIVVATYTIATVLVWYFHGPDDINKYLMTKIGGEPRLLSDGRPRIHDILVNDATGLMGRFMDIILNTIFPYLVLGALFGVSAGGQSLIKLAFRWTRHLRGGPAHAAIVSSSMFGAISGGPVINVLSTGVLTIPMMIKRGFSKVFAGGVEAAASSGGSIMPPVMGVAAFILAALTNVPYREVIIAALLPALAYYFCLFLSVMFQSRRQGIAAIGELTPDMHLSRQDVLNLVMIFGPVLLILILLLTSKEAVGCGWMGGLLGVTQENVGGRCIASDLPWGLQLVQNSVGDAGSAGWWAVALLSVLLFLDPEMRAKPVTLLDALSNGGILIATLYLMFLAVSIIDFCLNLTGLSDFIALDVLGWLKTMDLGTTGTTGIQLVALGATMGLAVLLGMGMPAAPAYINVALLMGPVLAGLGLSLFTANMFIFYFAVASAITPPVALAAFAAASITKAEPMATGFSAVRSGIVMFVIPFVFALYPELLLIDGAVLDPTAGSGEKVFLRGYEAGNDPTALWLLIPRLILSLYLLASALAGYDRGVIAGWEIVLRCALAIGVLTFQPVHYVPAIVIAGVLIGLHHIRANRVGSIA